MSERVSVSFSSLFISVSVDLNAIAFYMFSMSVETADSTDGDNLLTSSKQPTDPDNTIPINILDRLSLSMAESQLKTMQGLPNLFANALTVSVLPVPAGP